MTRYSHMLPGAFGRPLNYAGVLAGSPTVSILNGFGRDGLPTAIQFAGARLAENEILDAATTLERSTEWRHRRPDVERLMAARA